MPLFNVFDISGSGMNAQSLRMNLTASNMANADSVAGSAEEAYKSRQPVFSAVMDNMNANATDAKVNMMGVMESKAEHAIRYAPAHPMANEEGYVYEANVDIVEEMTNMISASRGYQSNVEILNTSKQMLLQTLNLGK